MPIDVIEDQLLHNLGPKELTLLVLVDSELMERQALGAAHDWLDAHLWIAADSGNVADAKEDIELLRLAVLAVEMEEQKRALLLEACHIYEVLASS